MPNRLSLKLTLPSYTKNAEYVLWMNIANEARESREGLVVFVTACLPPSSEEIRHTKNRLVASLRKCLGVT